MRWFDGHLDLAYLAVNGRDLTRSLDPHTSRVLAPHPPAAVTLPEVRNAGVGACLATIFTESGGTDAAGYPSGDANAAHARGLAQLDVYRRWAERGEMVLGVGDQSQAKPRHQREGREGLEDFPASLPRSLATSPASTLALPLRLILLMECADPIREPAEVEWWYERGVRAIGLAWARGSRYASGNGEPSCSSGVGLTQAGRELVKHIDRLGIAHDVSHLSDRAFGELMELADPRTPIVATHSNCRSLLGDPNNQRHLTDAQIREIASRGEVCEKRFGRGPGGGGGGVIGLNLFGKFLVPSGQYIDRAKGGGTGGRRATLADAVAHIDHICSLTGSTRHVALGSDMDGGFGADDLPVEIERAGQLIRLAEALHDRGWSDEDIHAFAWGNWARVWGLE